MKIGIDARFLTHPQVGGFKTYSKNLIKALGQIDHTNQYLIYVDRSPDLTALPANDNFSYRVVNGTTPGLGMPVREQIHLRRSLARDKPEIVHFLCNTATVGIPYRFVVTVHDTIQVSTQQSLRLVGAPVHYKHWAVTAYSRWATRKTASSAKRVLTVSNYEKARISRDLHVLPEHISVTHLAPNPVYTEKDSKAGQDWQRDLRETYGLHRRFILGVGYEPRKNIPLLVQAFRLLASAYPKLDLVVVAAEANSRRDLEQLVMDLQLENRVSILPSMRAAVLKVLYKTAEVFVFPSRREGFGLPPLEAMACGTPTIAMNLTSIPEIVQDGALLIDGAGAQTWADAIERVLKDDGLRKRLVGRGLKRASELTWEACARKTRKVYQEVSELES